MRRKNIEEISQIMKYCLKDLKIDKKLIEIHVINKWEEIIGRNIAQATTNIYIQNRVLFIHVNSSLIKQELFMIKEGIIKRFNEMAKEEIIVDLVLR